MNGSAFILNFYGALRQSSRDTLFARVRWIGLESGEDLIAPLDFHMFLVR
ncbi:MAG: hypothetical protein SFV22_05420 [Saprospiraceae bacterium]|nr:hypothetical protein [Saprospiraceae bacterium]